MMRTINVGGRELPCRVTMGAMLRFKRETGRDVSGMSSDDVSDLVTFMWCCVVSACRADGVEMEARSVEDDGDGICYHVFVYNEQPGVAIDHATGESHLAENAEVYASQAESGDERAEEVQTEAPAEQTQVQEQAAAASEYILNTNTMKFHRPSCSSVNQMSDSNKWVYDGTREEVLNMGYDPCKRCNP